ncbi:MAG: SPOR domain-containing protein [Bacteroidetes bacterium]|nr:MAG: SPOR domain-containing protein [Bacteroidota bacterium]
MPNLNVKGETPRSSAPASSGGGGIPKVLIIILVVVVVLGGAAFVLNTTGVVKLWGKKKAQPVLVSTPEETLPVTAQEVPGAPVDTTSPAMAVEENLTKLEANAPVPAAETKTVVKGSGAYTVQISSWPTREKAEAQAKVFADAGFEAFTEPLGTYFRVCIGRYETKAAAKAQAVQMEPMLETMPVIAKVGK